MFLSVLGSKTYALLHNLLSPALPKDTELERGPLLPAIVPGIQVGPGLKLRTITLCPIMNFRSRLC